MCVRLCAFVCVCVCLCVVQKPAVTGGGCSSTTSVTSSSLTSKILSTSIQLHNEGEEMEKVTKKKRISEDKKAKRGEK